MNDRTISLKSFAGFELFIEGKIDMIESKKHGYISFRRKKVDEEELPSGASRLFSVLLCSHRRR